MTKTSTSQTDYLPHKAANRKRETPSSRFREPRTIETLGAAAAAQKKIYIRMNDKTRSRAGNSKIESQYVGRYRRPPGQKIYRLLITGRREHNMSTTTPHYTPGLPAKPSNPTKRPTGGMTADTVGSTSLIERFIRFNWSNLSFDFIGHSISLVEKFLQIHWSKQIIRIHWSDGLVQIPLVM